MAKKRKTLRKQLRNRLSKEIKEAISIGKMTPDEGAELMRGAKGISIMFLVQLIVMIAEIISKFREKKEETS